MRADRRGAAAHAGGLPAGAGDTSAGVAAGATVSHGLPLPPPSRAPVGQSDGVRLTRVSLVHVERRLVLALRFGEPTCTVPLDACRRVAMFLPGAVFCRIHWRLDVTGMARQQLLVMQASTPLRGRCYVAGVQPGARVLLCADKPCQVRAVLARIDAIEALGIAPAAAAPSYWLALSHGLARRRPLPVYTIEAHALWQAGRGAP